MLTKLSGCLHSYVLLVEETRDRFTCKPCLGEICLPRNLSLDWCLHIYYLLNWVSNWHLFREKKLSNVKSLNCIILNCLYIIFDQISRIGKRQENSENYKLVDSNCLILDRAFFFRLTLWSETPPGCKWLSFWGHIFNTLI